MAVLLTLRSQLTYEDSSSAGGTDKGPAARRSVRPLGGAAPVRPWPIADCPARAQRGDDDHRTDHRAEE